MSAFASAFRDPRPPVALVGAGAMARALGLRLVDRGHRVAAVLSRSQAPAEALAALLGAPVASADLGALPASARLVLVCVGDGAVADVAETLAGAAHDWPETVVAHTSGALPASELQPLADEGAAVLSFHPLQAVPPGAGAGALDGAYVGLEGGARAVAAGIELAAGLDLRYLVLSADAKPRYHLAAAMASNFLVTLAGMVQEALASIDVDRQDATAMIEPLLRGTLDNLASSTPEEALTGPIVRGDVETLRQHGLALRRHLPQLVPVYAALSVETTRLAVRSGRLAPERAERVLALMQRMVTTPIPDFSGGSAADRPATPPPSAEAT